MENAIADQKKAKTDHVILDVIAKRWSPRAFNNKPVNEEILHRLFEAARWAPSSMNEQPWRFIYAPKGTKAHEKINSTLMEGNKSWAKSAPVLLLTLIKTEFSNGSPNNAAKHDLGLAMGNLSIQATHEGIGLHQMAGFSADQASKLFSIPEGFQPVTAIALGYFGDPETLPDNLKRREISERSRKPISEFAFREEFS